MYDRDIQIDQLYSTAAVCYNRLVLSVLYHLKYTTIPTKMTINTITEIPASIRQSGNSKTCLVYSWTDIGWTDGDSKINLTSFTLDF